MCGEPGIGKTVVLAEFSRRNAGIFVSAFGLSQKDLLGVLANKLMDRDEGNAIIYSPLSGAREAFKSAWKNRKSAVLVIDDYADLQVLYELIRQTGGASPGKVLVASARTNLPEETDTEVLQVEPLSRAESVEFLSSLNPTLQSEEAEALCQKAKGNPLLLMQSAHASCVLTDEIGTQADEVLTSLGEKEREIISYLSISSLPLKIEDIVALTGREHSQVGQIFSSVELAKHLIREDTRGYTIIHEQLRHGLLDEVQKQPQFFKYFSDRLAKRFADSGNYVQAFFVLDRCGSADAPKYLKRAIRDASRLGDVTNARKLLEKSLKLELDLDNSIAIAELSLALAQMAAWSGDITAEEEYLAQASELAESINDDELKAVLTEYRLSL